MRTTFDRATTVRLKPEIQAQIREIAEKQGNNEASVIRQALAAGLRVINPNGDGRE